MAKHTGFSHRFFLLALLVVEAGTAKAQMLMVPPGPTGATPPAATSGNYAGVTPGQGSKNPLPPAPAGSPRLIWTGFQTTPTGSRVFLQTTSPITYDVQEQRPTKSGRSTLVVVLRDCRIHMANNQRRLDTRAFPTPVQGFVAKQKRRDVELRISLREPATTTPTTEAGPDGTQFIILDFPPGNAENVESPALAGAGGGVLSVPAEDDAAEEGRELGGAATHSGRRPSFSGYGTSGGGSTTGAGTPPPAGNAPVNPWNPSGLGVDETPARGIRR